jgi:molecular chaperone GrpE
MSKQDTQPQQDEVLEQPAETPEAEAPAAETPDELTQLKAQLAAEQEKYLRLAAEYDNFRKRSQRERDALYTDLKAETTGCFLPVYDNLERALQQPTADEAYRKGVEMTMNQLVDVMQKLGVSSFGEAGDAFDPAMHNAVMHTEDEAFGENTVCEVFQKGFRVGDKVVRFAMVKVAN